MTSTSRAVGGEGLSSTARRVAEAFRKRYRAEPRLASAPGRVNLIGEHTDYNGGFVLPATIDRHVVVAFADNTSGVMRGFALERNDEQSIGLDDLSPAQAAGNWFDFAAGVAWSLQKTGAQLGGMDFVVGADLPAGAGLSSSAALELAVARALTAPGAWDPRAMARAARRAENEFVGMPCGIMDQLVVALGDEGHALLIDCQKELVEPVPMPDTLSIVVMDTGTRRSLVESAYQERRRSCEAAARAVGARSLREASWEQVERTRIDETSKRRARHVFDENERTLRLAEALQASDRRAIGELMAGSHASLRDLYDVSTPELDAMVAIALQEPHVVGARMTGAGFGGSAFALVEHEGAERFASEVEAEYASRTGKKGRVFPCRPAPPARLLDLPKERPSSRRRTKKVQR